MKWFRQKREEQKLKDLQDFFRSLSERMQEFDEGHFFPEQLEPTAIPVYELEQKPWRDGGEDTWCSADILQDPDILEILKKKDEASRQEEALADDINWSPDLLDLDKADETGTVKKRPVNAKKSHKSKEIIRKDDLWSEMDKELNKPILSFWDVLIKLIEPTGKTDPQIYKAANVSRSTFSRMKCDKDYHPDKETAVALAVALELDLQQMKRFLGTVGYALTPEHNRSDAIIQFFIMKKVYDLKAIDTALYFFGGKPISYKEQELWKMVQEYIPTDLQLKYGVSGNGK